MSATLRYADFAATVEASGVMPVSFPFSTGLNPIVTSRARAGLFTERTTPVCGMIGAIPDRVAHRAGWGRYRCCRKISSPFDLAQAPRAPAGTA